MIPSVPVVPTTLAVLGTSRVAWPLSWRWPPLGKKMARSKHSNPNEPEAGRQSGGANKNQLVRHILSIVNQPKVEGDALTTPKAADDGSNGGSFRSRSGSVRSAQEESYSLIQSVGVQPTKTSRKPRTLPYLWSTHMFFELLCGGWFTEKMSTG